MFLLIARGIDSLTLRKAGHADGMDQPGVLTKLPPDAQLRRGTVSAVVPSYIGLADR
jgi:hypothetical protein